MAINHPAACGGTPPRRGIKRKGEKNNGEDED
jgi:hypothetical protein